MHILYLDDSGSVNNRSDRHIILAGLTVFERQIYWLSQEIDRIAERHFPDAPQEVEFRGTDIRAGKKQWRKIKKLERIKVYQEVLQIIDNSRDVRVFGSAIHKKAIAPNDPMEYAFEQICSRFDLYLRRLYLNNNAQRGLIVLDKSSYETSLQVLAKSFRLEGHRWGQLRNLPEAPLFVDSRATRMIQLADLIAHGMRRYYENGDSVFFDSFSHKFDSHGGIIHGLIHYTPPDSGCKCLICRQKDNH